MSTSSLWKRLKAPAIGIPVGTSLILMLGGSAMATKQAVPMNESYVIPYTTRVVEDESQPTGWQTDDTVGVNGTGVHSYRVTRIYGAGIKKEHIKDEETRKPVERVQRVGILDTKPYTYIEDIGFAKTTKSDADHLDGYMSVTQPGKVGQRTYAYNLHTVKGVERGRDLVSDNVTTPPTDEVTTKGINYRVGAACSDGSSSNATGSGACSHHHGVGTWIYAYCSQHYSCWFN